VLGVGLGFTTEPFETDEADTTTVAAIDSATPISSDAAGATDDDLSLITLDVLDELEE